MHRDIRNYKYITTKEYKKLGNIKDNKIYIDTSEIHTEIETERQRTGFGYKRYFVCPICNTRHTRLYVNNKMVFMCRVCIDENIYAARTNLYDENVENIIKYKIIKLFKKLSDPIPKIAMIDFLRDIPFKPKYMREERYSLIVMRLYFLDWIYWKAVSGEKYTIREINDMLEAENTRFVYEHMLFPQYFRSAYEYIKEKEVDA